MPLTVTMHACSTCPVKVDFTVFRCYVAGYSIEETVEHLMSLREARGASSAVASPTSLSAISSPVAANAETERFQSEGIRLNEGGIPNASSEQARSHLQEEDMRHDTDEAPSALLPPEETLEVAVLVENASLLAVHPNGGSDPHHEGLAGGLAAEAVVSNPGTDKVDGDRRLPREAARAPTEVPDVEDREDVEGGVTPSAADRKKKRKEKTARRGKGGPRRGSGEHDSTHNTSDGMRSNARYADNSLAMDSGAGANTDDRKGKKKKHGGGRHRTDRHPDNTAYQYNSLSSGFPEPKTRNFFLNEDFLNFQKRLLQVEGGPTAGTPLSTELLFLETAEQYRLYELCIQEDFLSVPYAFLARHYLPIPADDRRLMVELYYEVDSAVFRYFFGDRMQKFEPIDTSHFPVSAQDSSSSAKNFLASLRTHGHPASPNGSMSAASPLAAATGSLLFRWAMHGAHNEDAIAYLLHINTPSLKRQWENLRRVCTTMVNMYLGKSDMYVPRGVSVLEAVQQCYGLRGELASSYATAVFGYHHRLTARLLDTLHDFAGYSTLCNIIAAQWCDQSLLLLDECFVDRCRRIAKLLDESRVLAELHQLLFGEVQRPRWQVQLDEVQRAITTTSSSTAMTDKTSVAAAAAALTTMMGAPVQNPQAPSSPLSMSVSASPAADTSSVASGSATWRPQTPRPHFPVGGKDVPLSYAAATPPAGAGATSAPLGHGSPSHSPHAAASVAALMGSGSPTASVGAGATVTQHSPLCANKQFSRRFMYEFTYVLRHLSKVAQQLGVNNSINDALETFHVRIFSYLEGMSTRSAPAVASMVLSSATAAAAAAGVAVGGPHSPAGSPLAGPTGNKSFSAGVGAAHPPADGISFPMARSHSHLPATLEEDSESPLGDVRPAGASSEAATSRTGGGDRSLSDLRRRTSSPSKSMVKANSVPTFASEGGSATVVAPAGLARGRGRNTSVARVPSNTSSARLDELVPSPSPPAAVNPITTVVNTSLSHPVTSLLPLSSLVAQQQAIGNGSSLVPPSAQGRMDESTGSGVPLYAGVDGNASGTFSLSTTPPPQQVHVPATATAGTSTGMLAVPLYTEGCVSRSDSMMAPAPAGQAFDPAVFGDVMLKALDKRFLRELSMFLSALPRVWRQLHTLTAEDHAACDEAFMDFIIALKAVTQILMAADDFH